MSDARFLRQVLLAEIGEAGQARLAAATARVQGPSLAAEIATRYAEGAGFGSLEPGPIPTDSGAPVIVTTPAAREVLAGSRAALLEIRRALSSLDPT